MLRCRPSPKIIAALRGRLPWTQGLADWIGAHTRAFAFIGGVTAMVVSDNLRSGITKACFYEPQVNRTYAEMAAHYGTAIIPARPYRARDKAKVEVAVQIAGGNAYTTGLPGLQPANNYNSTSWVTGMPTGNTLTTNVGNTFTTQGVTVDAIGAMATQYSGTSPQTLTYTTTADFTLNYAANTDLWLGMQTQNSNGSGFTSASLEVFVNGSATPLYDQTFTNLSQAQTYFSDTAYNVGELYTGGVTDVQVAFSETSSGDPPGFQFNYA